MLTKIIFITAVFFFTVSMCQSQNAITGRWYSDDSSRIFLIREIGNTYEAVLVHSKRINDTPGAVVLFNVAYSNRRKIYQGYIRAVDDGMTVPVKLKISGNGKFLQLKIRRLFLFPVYLKWRKEE